MNEHESEPGMLRCLFGSLWAFIVDAVRGLVDRPR